MHICTLHHPAHTFDNGEIGYQIELQKYKYLVDNLTRVAKSRQGTLDPFIFPAPKIPALPQEWAIGSIWCMPDLEMLYVTLHKDAENFLAFYWDIVAKEKETYRLPSTIIYLHWLFLLLQTLLMIWIFL